jgi:hypothetical protein
MENTVRINKTIYGRFTERRIYPEEGYGFIVAMV